jgi:hypothetical protein
MGDDTYDDFDERADLATADETIRNLRAENERLRDILRRLYAGARYVSESVWDDIVKALREQ